MRYQKITYEDSPEKIAALKAAKAATVNQLPSPAWVQKLIERKAHGEILTVAQEQAIRRARGDV